jgi:hypothetical protein
VLNEDKNQKLNDLPPLFTLCLVVTVIGLIVALMANAAVQVVVPIVTLLGALALYVWRHLN